MDLSPSVLHALVTRLLEEDVGYGDITTLATVPPQARGHGRFLAKEALVLAGLEVALAVFHTVDSTTRVDGAMQDGVSPCGQRFVELGKVFDLHFDFLQVGDGLPGQVDGRSDTASNGNMVVFNEHAVSQTKAMIVPTADPYRVLLEQAEPRGRLARINDACRGVPHALHIAPCRCRHT